MARIAEDKKLYSGSISDFHGYIKVPRVILYFLLKGDSSNWRIGAFADLINLLSCQPRIDKVTKTEQIPLGTNERRLAFKMLADRWGVSVGAVRYFMKQLEKHEIISKRIVKVGTKEHCIWKKCDMSHSTVTSTAISTKEGTKGIENQTDKNKTSTGTSTVISTETSTNIINKLSSSKKEIFDKKRKEFLNYLRTKEGKDAYKMFIGDNHQIKSKKYKREEILTCIDQMFLNFLNSPYDDVKKRLHEEPYQQLGRLQEWLISPYRKSSEQKKRKFNNRKEPVKTTLYSISDMYDEAQYNQMYSLLDETRQNVISDMFNNDGKHRAFRTLKEYCIDNNLIDAA